MSDAMITVGHIAGLHGVQGAVKVKSFCSPPEAVFNYQPWTITHSSGKSVTTRALKLRGSGALVARISDIEDRDQAATWLGAEVSVPRSALPTLKANEYYWSDLIGLRVINSEGVEFGQITGFIETGANDVIVIMGERERLVPYILDQYVLSIDLAANLMRVEWDADF
jgi:16S rRNA processing protein RimM